MRKERVSRYFGHFRVRSRDGGWKNLSKFVKFMMSGKWLFLLCSSLEILLRSKFWTTRTEGG